MPNRAPSIVDVGIRLLPQYAGEPQTVEVDVLGGEGVNRAPRRLLVHRNPAGRLVESSLEEPLSREVGEHVIAGWGALDGPAVQVRISEGGATVLMPQRAWEALEGWG